MPNYANTWPRRQGPTQSNRPVQYRQPAARQQPARGPMFSGYNRNQPAAPRPGLYPGQVRAIPGQTPAAQPGTNLFPALGSLWNAFVGGARQVRQNIVDTIDVTRPYRGTYGQTRIVPGQLNGPRTPRIQGTSPYGLPPGAPPPSRNVLPDTYMGQTQSWNDRGLGNPLTVMNQTLMPDTYFGMQSREADQKLGQPNNPNVPPVGTPSAGYGDYGGYGGYGYGGGGGGGGGGYAPADRVGQWVANMMLWNINRPTEG